LSASGPGGLLFWLPVCTAAGYLLGSLPFGWLFARARGVDIFAVGSKSCGATNVRRALGPAAGNIVFLLDAVKGAVAAGWPNAAGATLWGGLVGLGGALLGHSFSCFTGFRGGKGVATCAGGFLVLMPAVTLIAAAVWTALFFATGYVSLASIAAAVAIPTAAVFLGEPAALVGAGALIGAFVVFRHRSNIRRLIDGTENKAGRRARDEP
jgi:glycerol-3-phosphate acyltransferase PlsY